MILLPLSAHFWFVVQEMAAMVSEGSPTLES